MLEKVIHEDSTRCIVESFQDGMNKRKTASVYTPALATLHVKSLGVIPSSGEKQLLIQIWLRSYNCCCSMTKNRRRILACLMLFAKVGKLEKPSKTLDEIDALRSQYFRQYLRNTRPAGTLLQSRQFYFSET